LYINNCKESIEDKINFSASFIGYAKYKKYKLEYLEFGEKIVAISDFNDIRKSRVKDEFIKNVQCIFDAKLISEEEYKNKKNKICVTDMDLYEIYKYNLKNVYHIDDIDNLDKTFIGEYYDRNKMKWYKNISSIIDVENDNVITQTTSEKLEIFKKIEMVNDIDCYANFSKTNKYVYHYYALNIIDKLGFNINDLTTNIQHFKFTKFVEMPALEQGKKKFPKMVTFTFVEDSGVKFDLTKSYNGTLDDWRDMGGELFSTYRIYKLIDNSKEKDIAFLTEELSKVVRTKVINSEFKITNEPRPNIKIKEKYLKYKAKYLQLKKILIIT